MDYKNNTIAKKYRNAGNEHFRKQEYFDALMIWNRSLCTAESGSETIPIIYANRSAVYIKLKLFDLCLENIALARKLNYPAEKMEKLDLREKDCRELMTKESPDPFNFPENFFKLSYPANPKNPQLADCIELRNNKKFGNHVVTTRDLKAGDIIAVEESFYRSANLGARHYRCNYCLKDALMNLIPCSGCAMAMFCSEECQQKAKKEFHQFECNISGNPQLNLEYPLRMIVKCLRVFDFKVEELKKFLESNKQISTVFDFDLSDKNDPNYEKNLMLSTLSLQNSVPPMKMGKMMVLSEANKFVQKHPKLKKIWIKEGNLMNQLLEKIFASFFVTNISAWFSKEVNMVNDSFLSQFGKQMSFNPMRPGMCRENVGQGVFPFFALMNSSCDRNIANVCFGNKMVSYVCRPVRKDSQLFRLYCEPFYDLGPASVRRAQVKEKAGIWCDCEACKNNWPTYEGLPAVDPFFQYDTLRSFTAHKELKKTVERNNSYVNENFVENKPTQEVYITIDNNVFELNGLTRPLFYP